MFEYKRKVHLDFHTSPYIPNIGECFDKKQFQEQLIKGNVQSITLFAKCHHGYMMYPSKVGTTHPNLNFDLIGKQIEAAHEIGVKAPIYIPVGWSDLDSISHPEWSVVSFETGESRYIDIKGKENEKKPEIHWSQLCPTGDYLTLVEKTTEEICQRYNPVDGLFFDICFIDLCVCENCKKGMKELGLDPTKKIDVEKYYKIAHIAMMDRLYKLVKSYNKDASVFFNGCCTLKNSKEYLKYQTFYEMEVLPTAYGNFDDSDFICRKLEPLNKEIFGMTAKFQTEWGEFGGYKTKEALKYEIANCLSLGAGAIVGDHCHPNGYMDPATYSNIGYAYSYMKTLEDYALNTKRIADVGVIIAEDDRANLGLNIFLLEQQIDYRVVYEKEDLKGLKLLILPDNATIEGELIDPINEFIKNGGKILASGSSVFGDFKCGIEKIADAEYDVDYVTPNFEVGLEGAPMLMNIASFHTDGTDGGFKSTAYINEPYFSRTYARFSGHKNTPFIKEKSNKVALWEKENIIYFSHDIFTIYKEYGSSFVRNYILHALNKLYTSRITVCKDLSTVGRIRLRENEDKKYYILHLLYAVQIKRGKCYTTDDFPTFRDTSVELELEHDVQICNDLIAGQELKLEKVGKKTILTIPNWKMHSAILLKYDK